MMERNRRLLLGSFAFCAVAAWLATACGGDDGDTGSIPDEIAFWTDRDDRDIEIYVMNADGTSPINLTNSAAFDGGPAWSPDGTRIAFTTVRDGNAEIYVMNADGTGLMRLTNNGEEDDSPAWSPDGTQIAFATDRDGPVSGSSAFEIYVMNADGTSQTRLTNEQPASSKPAWSPDGTQIAFARAGDIYVMNADGTSPINLTPNSDLVFDFDPAWSPDGTQIAFQRAGEIYVMNADGTSPMNLTNHAAFDFEPAWSPDGTQITFSTDRDGNLEIYVMNADAPLDQSNSSASIGSAGFSGASLRGQIFTVGVTGALARIEVGATGNNATLVMEVMSVVGGLPDTVLATATNPTDVAAGGKSFDFTGAGVSATTSDVLAFLLSDPTNNGFLSNTDDTYTGGSRVSSNDGGASWILNPTDSNFSTYVLPPPMRLTNNAADDRQPAWSPAR
jgi:TolB protein